MTINANGDLSAEVVHGDRNLPGLTRLTRQGESDRPAPALISAEPDVGGQAGVGAAPATVCGPQDVA